MRNFLKKVCLRIIKPVHIGDYIRGLYFKKIVKRFNFNIVLDAGCGTGKYISYLVKKHPLIQINGYDINETNLQIARNLLQELNSGNANVCLNKQDLLELKESNKYDLIYSIDVLEHIKGNRIVIRNFYNALKKGGFLFIHMPSGNKKRLFNKRCFTNFDKLIKKEHVGEHYTLEELKYICQDIGFRVRKTKYTFGFLGELAWELDRITDTKYRLKMLLMPWLKILGRLDTILPNRRGELLILAQK